MNLLGKVRRLHYRDGHTLSEIERRTGLTRKTIRKWLQAPEGTEPKYRLMIETDTRHSTHELSVICWEVCDLVQRETGTPAGAKIEVLNVSAGGLVPRPETDHSPRSSHAN